MSEQKVNIELPMAEATLLMSFLDDLREKYSRAGCNDIEIENTDANWRMVQEAWQATGDEDAAGIRPTGKSIMTWDLMLCDHIAQLIDGQFTVDKAILLKELEELDEWIDKFEIEARESDSI